MLAEKGINAELVYIKSEGDIDLNTPLYEMGVTGIFTKTLDVALLNNEVDLAVHSMKDVPVVPAKGIRQAAVLERGSFKDIVVYKRDLGFMDSASHAVIASCSIRRIAQWLHRFPNHSMVNLRGNVDTRLRKLEENDWDAAIFAAAGLERIGMRPEKSADLDWMLPAPAQGAIMVVCRDNDQFTYEQANLLNHDDSALCTFIERSFLRTLHAGCSSPVSALAEIKDGAVRFKGNIASHDGRSIEQIEMDDAIEQSQDLGQRAARKILDSGKDWIRNILKR
jgi:hydroxymethylbilane synthase